MFEHVTKDQTLVALNDYLGYPRTCPHGGSIYINLDEEEISKKLLDLKVGQKGKIVRVRDNKDFLNYIEQMSINLGDEIEVTQINSFDKQRTVLINGRENILSPKACSMLYVE